MDSFFLYHTQRVLHNFISKDTRLQTMPQSPAVRAVGIGLYWMACSAMPGSAMMGLMASTCKTVAWSCMQIDMCVHKLAYGPPPCLLVPACHGALSPRRTQMHKLVHAWALLSL